MTDNCTCGQDFLDPEDYRDHLPCEGNTEQQLKNALLDLTKKVDNALPFMNFDPIGSTQTHLRASRDRAVVLLSNHNWWK